MVCRHAACRQSVEAASGHAVADWVNCSPAIWARNSQASCCARSTALNPHAIFALVTLFNRASPSAKVHRLRLSAISVVRAILSFFRSVVLKRQPVRSPTETSSAGRNRILARLYGGSTDFSIVVERATGHPHRSDNLLAIFRVENGSSARKRDERTPRQCIVYTVERPSGLHRFTKHLGICTQRHRRIRLRDSKLTGSQDCSHICTEGKQITASINNSYGRWRVPFRCTLMGGRNC